MLAAAALSKDPDGPAAARAAVAAACRGLGATPDVVLVLATPAHDPRPTVAAARAAAAGARVVGCAVSGVIVDRDEVEDGPALAAMALAGSGLEPFLADGPERVTPPRGSGAVLLLADGYSRHPDELGRALWPGWQGAGTLATAPDGVYPAHRWLDDEIAATGLAGLFVGPAIIGVTQGCQPIGPAHTVTRADGLVVAEIDGCPAFAVFADAARPLLDDLARAAQTVFLAVHAGDGTMVRGILRFDPDRGLLATSAPIPAGARFWFAARDAWAARADLRRMAADVARRLEGRPARAACYFSGAGRGRGLFGVDGHDVAYLRAALGDVPLIGAFGGGELGPIGGGTGLHLFSGVLVVLP